MSAVIAYLVETSPPEYYKTEDIKYDVIYGCHLKIKAFKEHNI
jgi:hypothetical protein